MTISRNKYLSALFIVAAFQGTALAQQGFVASGGDASGGTGSAAFSVGQLADQPVNNAGTFLIEGLQQPDMAATGLPVTLLYFRAASGGGQSVMLQWVTLYEDNVDHFTVERSGNAVDFSRLADVAARGNSGSRWVYNTVDSHPLGGNSYYRLAITDMDGTTRYSPVVKVSMADVPLTCFVGPNPAKGVLYIFMNAPGSGRIQYRIMDLQGRKLAEGFAQGDITRVDLTRLTPAHYILQLLQKGKLLKSFTIARQ